MTLNRALAKKERPNVDFKLNNSKFNFLIFLLYRVQIMNEVGIDFLFTIL